MLTEHPGAVDWSLAFDVRVYMQQHWHNNLESSQTIVTSAKSELLNFIYTSAQKKICESWMGGEKGACFACCLFCVRTSLPKRRRMPKADKKVAVFLELI